MTWRRLLLLLLALSGGLRAAELEGDQPVVIQAARLEYPREAAMRGMDGFAKVVIEVDETGRLVDYLVAEASHEYFAAGAVKIVEEATYLPARLDGKPVPLRAEVPIEFKADGIIVNSDFQTIVDLYLQGGHARERSFRLATLQDLDRIPVPIQVDPPPFPADLARQGVVGEVVIDFYIDEKGMVRMPAIASGEHDELETLAVNAVRSWRFEPPLRDGRPVIVRVRQPFRFREGSPVAE